MDVENLAKELILKNMTPEQQMAVLDSVRQSVAQAKEVQKRKIGENVDLVVQALKKIEADIRSRYDDVGNAIEKRVASIKDGRDGINGKDGRDGKDGKSGRDGAKGDKGDNGRDGRDGVDGTDGVSVTSARIDFDGSLVITLSSGVELNVGEVVAPDLAERIKVITNGGGTSQSVLDTLDSLQTQIDTLIPSQTGNSGKFLTTNGTSTSWASVAGGLSYQGTWNASTNTPTLASSTGTNGYYYIVATAGSTNLNGITDWAVGDWLMFNGTVWQKIDQSETLQSITSTDGSVTVTTTGSTADLSVAVAASTTNVICYVRNTTGATLTKGTAVYISGATSQNPTVTKAQANNDTNSAQTLGLMSADLANNSNGYVTIIGLITNINTSAYTDGEQLYLSPTTAGALTATKPYAPNHLVYVAIVEHAHPTQGKLFVKVQNGYEMDELHNVSAQSPSNGQVLIYNESTSLWEKHTLTDGTGISITEGAGSITVGLASSYGDTQNPYASKTANYVLAAPNGSAGAPTFRAIVAADIPTLNQSTTGSAATLTTPRAIYGNNFDGSAALTQIIASTYGGTGNGFTKFSGATTAEKTYTLPNSNATLLYDGGALGTPSSGTVTNLTGTASININGTVGATTAAAGTFTTVTANTSVTTPIVTSAAATSLTLKSAGTTAVTIDTSQNVLVGTTTNSGVDTGSQRLVVNGLASGGGAAICAIADTVGRGIRVTDSSKTYTAVYDMTTSLATLGTNQSIPLTFITVGSERCRIDTSGNLLVGTTNNSATAGVGMKFIFSADSSNPVVKSVMQDSSGAYSTYNLYCTNASAYRFYVTTAGVVNATTTTITAISDQRLKENIRDLDDGLEKVLALKPRKFDWKENKGENIKNARGFIAQELELVFPDMVSNWIDEPPEGEEPYKAVNANLIPSLVKAIQEQQALIVSMREELDALKTKVGA